MHALAQTANICPQLGHCHFVNWPSALGLILETVTGHKCIEDSTPNIGCWNCDTGKAKTDSRVCVCVHVHVCVCVGLKNQHWTLNILKNKQWIPLPKSVDSSTFVPGCLQPVAEYCMESFMLKLCRTDPYHNYSSGKLFCYVLDSLMQLLTDLAVCIRRRCLPWGSIFQELLFPCTTLSEREPTSVVHPAHWAPKPQITHRLWQGACGTYQHGVTTSRQC